MNEDEIKKLLKVLKLTRNLMSRYQSAGPFASDERRSKLLESYIYNIMHSVPLTIHELEALIIKIGDI